MVSPFCIFLFKVQLKDKKEMLKTMYEKILSKMNMISFIHGTYVGIALVLLIMNSYQVSNRSIISDFMIIACLSLFTLSYIVLSNTLCSAFINILKTDIEKCKNLSFINFHLSKEKELSIINILKIAPKKYLLSLLLSVAFLIKVCINLFIIWEIKFILISVSMSFAVYIISIHNSKLIIQHFKYKKYILNILEGYKVECIRESNSK